MTQRALAISLGLTPQTITMYKSGDISPSPETVSALVRTLGFPEEFFYGADLDEPNSEGVSFRSLSRMTARQRDMALAQGALALSLSRWIEQRFELPTPDFPDYRHLQPTPGAAAAALRHSWGIGEMSIRNMVHLLESKGARIFSLSLEAKEVDAFSTWSGKTPIILLNNFKSSERSRFDAAHELGHLVLHRHGEANNSRELESQADAFASAFLMPERSVIAQAPKILTISNLIALKKIFGVALSAIVYRLHNLKLLSEWNYRSLCIEIGKRGYRSHEPDESLRETSLVLREILRDLYESNGMTRAEIAQSLALPISELDALWFGLTFNAMAGSRNKEATPRVGGPTLIRVK